MRGTITSEEPYRHTFHKNIFVRYLTLNAQCHSMINLVENNYRDTFSRGSDKKQGKRNLLNHRACSSYVCLIVIEHVINGRIKHTINFILAR